MSSIILTSTEKVAIVFLDFKGMAAIFLNGHHHSAAFKLASLLSKPTAPHFRTVMFLCQCNFLVPM